MSFFRPHQDHLGPEEALTRPYKALGGLVLAAGELGCFWLVALALPGLVLSFLLDSVYLVANNLCPRALGRACLDLHQNLHHK